ncbi:uncharacterized protein LOC107606784 [Arachis ipaensis]|uniref:uncharacterized protein LOC107606784 n=1 Tax=Arachis ipaensis TaxID=130454 RepID=UPI0007AFB00E|nr:uncharacterized protein LOC107606784 [Arachis ipaensis]XP_025664501.1 uncharacterized protein LOC112762906 [Arachis hypogaea]
MGATPFHHLILEVWLTKHFDKPTDMRYDGTQDPQEHLTAFEARMNLEGVGDEVRCCAFPVTLAGPSRLLGTVHHVHCQSKAPNQLAGVTQRNRKPTRKYLDRFNDECLEIDALTDSVASLYLTNGLLNEDFRKHLTTKPVWTMQEIQNVVREYINDEEVSQVVPANKRAKEHSKDGGPAKAFKPFPRVGKFTNYTPLTTPIVEVYQQIADKGILSKSQQLKDRTEGNKNLYCDYHKGFGHKTQDWSDRDRAGDDKSRVVRQRQEPEEDNECGFTMVNVVVGRDVPPRSKSASRKDAKVLAVSSSNSVPPSRRVPSISFRHEDQWFNDFLENPPMVIIARVGTGLVK